MKNFVAFELAVELHGKVEVIGLKGNLKDQLERAASSVVLNLAEGSAKPTQRDRAKFYATAFGSIREVQAVFRLIRLQDAGVLDLADHIAACVFKLMRNA